MGDHEFLNTPAEVATAFAGFSTLISFVAARQALPLLNKIYTFGVHPICIVILFLGASNFINVNPAWLYVTGLFVMLFFVRAAFHSDCNIAHPVRIR